MSGPTKKDKAMRAAHKAKLDRAAVALKKLGYGIEPEDRGTFDTLIVDLLPRKVSLATLKEQLAEAGVGDLHVERYSYKMAVIDDVRGK